MESLLDLRDCALNIMLALAVWPLGACIWLLLKLSDGFRRTCSRRASPVRLEERLAVTGVVSLLHVADLSTEIMTWQPAASSGAGTAVSDVLLIVMPGNPGAVQFYGPFLERVHQLSGRRIGIMCVGHASHSSRTAQANGRQLLDLKQQVAHKNAVLLAILSQHPTARLVLAGHSIGAYMAVEACRVLPSSSVLACIGLFPTLMNIGASVNGLNLMPLFKFGRGALWLAAHVVRLLPARVQDALVRAQLPAGVDPAMTPITASTILHPTVAYNALWMALHEMRELLELDEAHFASVQSKVRLYLASRDDWVVESDVAMLQARHTGVRVTVSPHPGDVHAYVLYEGAYTRVAQFVWGVIAEEAAGGGGQGRGPRASPRAPPSPGSPAARRRGSRSAP